LGQNLGASPFYEQLDRRWRPLLMMFFGQRLRNRQEAEDLTQETFVRLIRARGSAAELLGLYSTIAPAPATAGIAPAGEQAATGSKSSEGGFRSYVFTIATNLLRDHARKSRTHERPAHCSFDEISGTPEPALTDDIDPERVLLSEERLQLVLAALAELGERTADVFVLVRMEKMKQREVAALYGISVSAVEKILARAAAHLAARLAG
jgi:RNA polymerase sigma-70 factor (ECF subfamily)